jgi:universal stress protein A
MTDYQHILIAVDFSSESSCVIDRALELAKIYKSQISLIHVVEYAAYLYPPDTPIPFDLDLEQQFIEKARENLASVAEQNSLKDASRFIEVGSPAMEIVRVGREEGVDLIVLGSHGRHGLQRILGSTASGVLHGAECDVLAVRFGLKAN